MVGIVRSAHHPRQAIFLGLFILGALSLLFFSVPIYSFFWKAVANSGHGPLFFVVGLLVLNLSRALMGKLQWAPLQHYLVAFIGIIGLSVVTEVFQLLIPMREPQVSDVLHDVVGGICGLVWSITRDHALSAKWEKWKIYPRRTALSCGIALVMTLMFIPVFEWAYAYWDRSNRFPSILQFSSDWEMRFVNTLDSEVLRVPPPLGWGKSSVDLVGQVVFHTKKYPRIRIRELYPDWNGYSQLYLEIFSELSAPQRIVIWINDRYDKSRPGDGYKNTLTIVPGLNQIQIPLHEIRMGPVGREMNLSGIKEVMLFARSPAEEFTLYIDNIHLQ